MQSVRLELAESLQQKIKHTRHRHASESSVQQTGFKWTERELEDRYEIEEKRGVSDDPYVLVADYGEDLPLEQVKDMEALYSPFSESVEYGVPYQLYDGDPVAQELIRQQKELTEQMRKTLKAFEDCE